MLFFFKVIEYVKSVLQSFLPDDFSLNDLLKLVKLDVIDNDQIMTLLNKNQCNAEKSLIIQNIQTNIPSDHISLVSS